MRTKIIASTHHSICKQTEYQYAVMFTRLSMECKAGINNVTYAYVIYKA